ncbi:MAG: PAS domain S-box protein, partial [Burkholderiales bacterium]|nr:PAS domain S-box protein [Burkholderiales bacterium]
GALLAVLAAALMGAVAAFAPAPPPALQPAAWLHLGADLLSLAAGLGAGVVIARMLNQALRAAQDREDRFRRLLALAADAYWEIDREHRLVAGHDHGGGLAALNHSGGLGRVPWELPQFSADPDTLDAIQADIDTRAPFRDQPVRWTGIDERERALLVSGEPRFDERGAFAGYWGVARDVTAVQDARAALAATETRYHDLFVHLPTPLVLHRGGRVIDANPAAVAMFGYDNLRSMLDTDLLAHYEGGDSRERARRRIEALHAQPLGSALPVSDFRLVIGERRLSVRATAVRVEAAGGPAMLAIFVDDSERLAAEEAVRRSEALLSHLVATSPDLITLTDLATGRYAMVNHAFERLSGWSAAEAVGRTALELGIWGSDEVRGRFVAQLREHGVVSDLPVTFVAKDGTGFSLVVSAARFVMDRREYMVINARDVTEKERERQERDAILRNASIGIAVTRERRFVLANAHFEHIHGWGSGELLGQGGAVVWGGDAEEAEVDALAGPALARGERVEFERVARRRDGSCFVARIRGHAIDPQNAARAGTVWIVEDVTERREFERALARARDEAEAASRAKSAFLANTSHELRTPLNGMIGLARMARQEGVDGTLRQAYLDQILDSAQSLAGIISDILDLSKIEAGKLLIEHTAFDLGELLRQLLQGFAPQAAARGLALALAVAPEAEGVVLGDPLRVRQIVTNFLTNALKFTEQGGIDVRVHRLAGDGPGATGVRLAVRDSGPGIAPAARERLFRPFTQADESTTRRFGGTGLGLSICRELATLMGGTVGVDSQPGQGSCFWAELPLPATAEPLLAPAPASDAGLAGMRVLLVEDNPVNMLIASAMLERWGVAVAQAHDGREALARVQQASAAGADFDAVLMDVQMPVMSGHEATRALRETPAGARLPIIALTAAALVSEREEALQAGMNDFLTKPIDPDKLRAALVRWCTVRA